MSRASLMKDSTYIIVQRYNGRCTNILQLKTYQAELGWKALKGESWTTPDTLSCIMFPATKQREKEMRELVAVGRFCSLSSIAIRWHAASLCGMICILTHIIIYITRFELRSFGLPSWLPSRTGNKENSQQKMWQSE